MAAPVDPARRDALVERLFEASIGALELYSIYLGWRLGLYSAMAGGSSMTASELAAAAKIDPRYAQEWLEQQAVAGLLDVDPEDTGSSDRRFTLPASHAAVLADPVDPAHVAPFAPMLVGIAGALPAVAHAYRTGDGVAFDRYGPDLRDGQGAINRPAFTHEMASWIAAAPGVHAALSRPGARVADVGCGQGFSTVAIARAYPDASVDGIDLDEASVADAHKFASDAGVADRVVFSVRDAAGLAAAGPYDLVCVFEALHDMARPVDALAAMRSALAPGGAVLVADERVSDSFTAPGDLVERMMYGWSVSHCLPASRAEQPSAALGTVLRADTVERLATEAGFATVEQLAVENDFFRFYLMTP